MRGRWHRDQRGNAYRGTQQTKPEEWLVQKEREVRTEWIWMIIVRERGEQTHPIVFQFVQWNANGVWGEVEI